MPRFSCTKSELKTVTLEQDDDDVNIHVNGCPVAYFNADDGKLHLFHGVDPEQTGLVVEGQNETVVVKR